MVNTPGTKATSILVPAAPTFPAPNIPSALPLEPDGNHAEFQAIPAEKELPPRPKRIAQTSISPNVEAWLNMYVGTATASSSHPMIFRPPNVSAQMPKFK